MTQVIVRKANLEDVLKINHLCKMFLDETNFAAMLSWNSEKAFQSIFNMILSDNYSIFVATYGDMIVGCIAGYVSAMWFSDSVIGQELFWYVNKDFRGKTGIQLFKKLECDLIEKGADFLNFVYLKDKTNLEKFFLRNEYTESEKSFIKKVA